MPTRKSCGSILRCGLAAFGPMPSIGPPTARCCTPCARRDAHRAPPPHRLGLAPCLPSRPTPTPTRNPHSARCTCRRPTHRDFVPSCISDAGVYGAGMGSSLPASEMLHREADSCMAVLGALFDQSACTISPRFWLGGSPRLGKHRMLQPRLAPSL